MKIWSCEGVSGATRRAESCEGVALSELGCLAKGRCDMVCSQDPNGLLFNSSFLSHLWEGPQLTPTTI